MIDQHLYEHLAFLYGAEPAQGVAQRLHAMLAAFRQQHPRPKRPLPHERVSERDAILITYGDMAQEAGTAPLATLASLLKKHLSGAVSTVHILPFYPYSSDDGFSIIDYRAVNPALGEWKNVAEVGQRFRLMFDAVINHISAHSAWFQMFLQDVPRYRHYFITVEPGTDLSQVFRPRALPLLTPVATAVGEKLVWTTFSADQIDLNYANPDVLLEIIELLLFYVEQGAEFIRLDAIGFMWKEIGTSCIHRPQTHRAIQLMRSVLDEVAPGVALITETNVPHAENIAYFGDGRNEAQMVYNFSLPPLTLHAFHTGNAEAISRWADTLTLPSDEVTFFNFLASHDGIGVMPARGILSESAVTTMAERVKALGGYVSYKNNPNGSQSTYELNINYLDALGDTDERDEPIELVARRFLASQAIMLALRGVPGIYFHSLFGSRGWPEGVQASGRFRTINRQKLQRAQLEQELADPDSLRHHVFHGYIHLLKQRAAEPAFHPNGQQQVLFCHPAVFALLRTSPCGQNHVLCLHNVSNQPLQLVIDLVPLPMPPTALLTDRVSGQTYPIANNQLNLPIAPYQVLWLQNEIE